MPLPFEDKQSVAEIIYDQTIKQWILKNHSIRGLSILSPSKKDIPKGGKELLLNGVILRLGDLSTSRIAKIHFNNGE